MSQCPCGSSNDYLDCCGMYLSDQAIPETPLALMRSRYCAYSMANIDYIKKTMMGKPLQGFNESDAMQWAKSVYWMGLRILNTHRDETSEQIGFVEFIATYLYKDTVQSIHENSQFQAINGRWYYVDGEHVAKPSHTKISRNAPCPCGSKRKFKNCHLSSSF